ncbi:MAG: hypothetical protein GF416_04445 [Candidatus Altiarchaeales archaeon]|nr:hypothetical protein [Candidatus Altiarchaeales archaeon]MBD3416370.1 hypothetical protein [Candidatus Altiarchaeales archaeon]
MILIVDLNREGSLATSEFVAPIASTIAGIESVTVRHYSEVSSICDDVTHVILSGTPLKETGYLDSIDSFNWIGDCEAPVLGICAGMQVICLVHGSKLVECQEIGMTEVEVTGDNRLCEGRFKAYELHNLSVDVGGDFTVLGSSRDCIQLVKHADRELYGVLFHPEVRNRDIIRRFIKLK